MSDLEVATKAPESDAAAEASAPAAAVEQSPIPGDSIAQEGPSMGEHCVTDRPTPAGEEPVGELSILNNVDVYISKPADYPQSPGKLLLLLTGGTGVRSTNNQLQADKYAAEGFLVVMPDQFGGDPAPNSVPEPLSTTGSFLERFKLGVADTAKSFLIDMWLARHTPEKVLPILYDVIDGVKDNFADAIANGGGIYAVGYCFGAKYVLLLGGKEHQYEPNQVVLQYEPEQGVQPVQGEGEAPAVVKGPVIKVAAIAHGTSITTEDIEQLGVPTCLICVENDPLFPDEVLKTGIQALEKNEVVHEVKVYPQVPHGFAVYGDYDDGAIKAAQQTAFGQMLGWLQAH